MRAAAAASCVQSLLRTAGVDDSARRPLQGILRRLAGVHCNAHLARLHRGKEQWQGGRVREAMHVAPAAAGGRRRGPPAARAGT